MNNYAYATYLDRKEFLPGLRGLYYSLINNNSQYDLIILYQNITENDIWKVIEKNKVILFKIPNDYTLNQSTKIDTDFQSYKNKLNKGWNILDTIYYDTQYSSTLNPMYMFSFFNYDAILYLHCDVIVLKNCDDLFLLPKDKYIAYGNNFYGNNNLDANYLLIFPNLQTWIFIQQNLKAIINDPEVTNLDMFLGRLSKYFYIGKFYFNMPMRFWHCAGSIKYWDIFPNLDITNINLDVINFMEEKIKKIKLENISNAYDLSIKTPLLDRYEQEIKSCF